MKLFLLFVVRKRILEGLIVLKMRVMWFGSVCGCLLYEYVKYVFQLEYIQFGLWYCIVI